MDDAQHIAQAYDCAYPSYALSKYRWNALNESGNKTSYTPPGAKMGSAKRVDHHRRASEISHGLGMLGLAPAEAAYAGAGYSSDGQALVGSKNYGLHIPPGGIPSNVFWSVTLYEFKQGSEFLAPNPVNRHRVSSHNPEFVRNADGSIDVWVQATRPTGDKATNWLPSPANGKRFWFIARSYGPPGLKCWQGNSLCPL